MSIMTDSFFDRQLAQWSLAADNYAALQEVETKTLDNGAKVQFNPARMVSTGAKMDAATLKQRPCFLCKSNRPFQQHAHQLGEYELLVNPYPIFPRHFTIPARHHAPQRIYGSVASMAEMAKMMSGYTVFYNGPHCGASAPDHKHFQAVNSDFLPIWTKIPDEDSTGIQPLKVFGSMGVILITAKDEADTERLFEKVYNLLPSAEDEPMVNILVRATNDHIQLIVIPRIQHRPSFYGSGDDQMILSPACVDLGGVFITPRREDFMRFDVTTAHQVYAELCMDYSQIEDICRKCNHTEIPTVRVGIISSNKLEFILHGTYRLDGEDVTGKVRLSTHGFKDDLHFVPIDDKAYVELPDVVIGVNFHWERRETLCFKGAITIVHDGDELVFINEINIEDYLTSVISSEMSATSSLELLKAHAVISRSWVLAQMRAIRDENSESPNHGEETPDMRIVWYDHDDHTLFDVCADDHCQRYQGITRASTEAVRKAIAATRGQVLVSDGELCDARFSKCCGGVFEQFENCWDNTPKPYLVARRDSADATNFPDLTHEDAAQKWILSSPLAFCNTSSASILRQVLNSYDQETADFYRWSVEYDTDYLSDLVLRRTGIDFGKITDLIPLERGTSGRIVRLRIIGEKRTMIIGKELEIRRALSESHLYSSAFVVERTDDGFRLRGAGWGHGVGLCQIGAAVISDEGYDYRQILSHYYPNSEIVSHYFS